MASSNKPTKVNVSGHKEQKSGSRKSPGELVRKPSGSSLIKNSERKMSVAASGRKLSVASQSSSVGRKLSTVKCRHPAGALTRKMSSSSDRFSIHSGHHQPGLLPMRAPPTEAATSSSVVGFRQLLVTKRLARNLKLRTTQRLAERRGRSYITYSDRPRRMAGHQHHSPQPDSALEPTYQVEPAHKFGEFRGTIGDLLDDMIPGRLAKISYDARLCSRQAKLLAGDIQERVKELRIDRYKLITVVHIGEIQQQTVRVCSRGIWDVALDSFVTYEYQNASLYCVATVFGIYHE